MFRWLLPLFLLGLSACGMTEDPREEEKRQTFPTIPDPNFEAYLLEFYDLNRDGRFSYYEAERILVVDCQGRAIASLAGIESFVQLRELRCNDNHIESLDLRENRNLEYLDCSHNALYQLALEGLRELHVVVCAENRLPHLDFINTPAVHTIDCSYNELQLLDITHCARTMKRVDARFNPLTTLYKSSHQTIDFFQPGSGEVVERE